MSSTLPTAADLLPKDQKMISDCCAQLLLECPWIGICSLRYKYYSISDEVCKTACTDGNKIYICQTFLKTLDKGQMTYIIWHEIMHCILLHFYRQEFRIGTVWNLATDNAINLSIEETASKKPDLKFRRPFENVVCVKKYAGKSAEEIYTDMIKNAKLLTSKEMAKMGIPQTGNGGSGFYGKDGQQQNNSGQKNNQQDQNGQGQDQNDQNGGQGNQQSNVPGNVFQDKDGTWKKVDGVSDDVKFVDEHRRWTDQQVRDFKDNAGAALNEYIKASRQFNSGGIPNDIARIIEEMFEFKPDWRDILKDFVKSFYWTNSTFMRRGRRSSAIKKILPGHEKKEKIKLAIAFDTSGSIGTEEISEFLNDIKNIIHFYNKYEIDIWCFEGDVVKSSHEKFTERDGDKILEYKPRGCGGTCISSNWKYMKENDINADGFICFTDGYTDDSDLAACDPKFLPTLWCIYDNDGFVAPFGRQLKYETHHGKED